MAVTELQKRPLKKGEVINMNYPPEDLPREELERFWGNPEDIPKDFAQHVRERYKHVGSRKPSLITVLKHVGRAIVYPFVDAWENTDGEWYPPGFAAHMLQKGLERQRKKH